MAEPKKSFPMLPIAHWWTLRKKFKQSIPGVVTDNYLATVLNMEVRSARANVLPYLKVLGITDDDGKTLERARLWRDDGHYAEVCKAILSEVYPSDLLEAAPNPEDRAQEERWFANHTGSGEAAVRRMAVLYGVLRDADPSKQPQPEKKEEDRKKVPKQIRRGPAGGARAAALRSGVTTATTVNEASQPVLQAPGININLEIHISADATSDQIDQIFASMAKHIYKRG